MGLFVKACRDSIESLKNSIGIEEKQAYGTGWLQALGRGSPHADQIAHQHGVVSSSSLLISGRQQHEFFLDLRQMLEPHCLFSKCEFDQCAVLLYARRIY